ncbi:MAG: hypothetical protein K9L88_18585 [Chromatiaceae bacterium]|nr:hypothetical protein [Chromatiaceae bacterium]
MTSKPPEKTRTDIKTARDTIAVLGAELDSFDDTGLTKDEWKARSLEWVDSLADRFESEAAYKLTALRAPRPYPGSRAELVAPVVTIPHGDSIYPAGADVSGPLAWLLRDQLKAHLARVIDATNYEEGPPLAERPQRRAALERNLLAAEITEELLIRELEAATGEQQSRRGTAQPSVVLDWTDSLQNRLDDLNAKPKRR